MTAHYIGGNLSNQYNDAGAATSAAATALNPFAPSHLSQTLMVQGGDTAQTIFNGGAVPITVGGVTYAPGATIAPGGKALVLPNQQNATFNRDSQGWNIRANFGFDFASNTAYGPLIGHMDFNSDLGSGLDSPRGSFTYVNQGYITWAGITAGKAQSFYSFIGGGDNWNNFFSPDQKGFNEPILFAYTASFGGGFTATLAAQSQGTNGASGGGTNMTGGYSDGGNNLGTGAYTAGVAGPTTFGGQRWPDIVGALHVKQGWGEAQVSGVIHNVNVRDYGYFGTDTCGIDGGAICGASEGKVGWGVDAGVKVNLPSFGAGDDVILTGSFTQNAAWYSGLPDAQNGENGQVNGNGQPMYMADAYFNPLTNSWAKPTAWSASALLEHHWTPTIYTDLEGSVGGINWSGQSGGICTAPGVCAGTGMISPHAFTYLIGADIGWNPGHQPELRPRVDVSARDPGCAERQHRNHLQHRRLHPGRLGRRLERLPGSSPRHPLLLIATRSVEIRQPRSESSGVFCALDRAEKLREYNHRASIRARKCKENQEKLLAFYLRLFLVESGLFNGL